MEPGIFRETVEIQKKGYAEDDIGNQATVGNLYYRCRAYVNNLSGTEYWAAAQVQAEETVVFTVRYCSKIQKMNTVEYGILWKGQYFNITSIDNVMNRNETVKIRGVRKQNAKKNRN